MHTSFLISGTRFDMRAGSAIAYLLHEARRVAGVVVALPQQHLLHVQLSISSSA